MISIKLYLIIPTFLILAISCENQSNDEITDILWMLQSIEYENDDVITIDNSSSYTVLFDDSSRVEGQADCNTCGGDYEISNSSISISFGCTKKGCGASSKGWEYFLAVNDASSYEMVGKELLILFDSDKSTLYFKKD